MKQKQNSDENMKPKSMQLPKSFASGRVIGLLAGSLWIGGSGLTALSQAVFTVDPGQSSVSASGTLLGLPLREQGAGSLTAHLGGALYVQLGQTSIQFTSGSRVFALDSGSWQPLPDGSDGSAPANYGGAAGDSFTSGVGAARQVEVDITSGVVAVIQGRFDVSPLTFTIPAEASSSLAYRVQGWYDDSGAISLGGASGSGMSTTGSLVTVGNVQTLTIPVNYTAYASLVSPNDVRMTLTGQLVAIRTL
jgi:hypothetical protein